MTNEEKARPRRHLSVVHNGIMAEAKIDDDGAVLDLYMGDEHIAGTWRTWPEMGLAVARADKLSEAEAAPDLLEVLEELTRLPNMKRSQRIWDAARAAIARAHGIPGASKKTIDSLLWARNEEKKEQYGARRVEGCKRAGEES